MTSHPLVDEFRTRAAKLIEWGAPDAALIWELAASALEAHERDRALENLTLTQASSESGFSLSQLSRLITDQKIENVGKKGAPRLRRGDLPKKPSRSYQTNRLALVGEPDLVGRAFGASPTSP